MIGVLYLKDVIKRVYDTPDAQTTERVELDDAPARPGARTPSRSTSC